MQRFQCQILIQLLLTLIIIIRKQMENQQDRRSRPCKIYFYIIMDILYAIFGILYMIGQPAHYNITVLRFAKPLPIWILMIQLLTVRHSYSEVKLFVIGLAFGSIGDIFLELQEFGFALFAIGAFSFLVGHVFYVVSFLSVIQDISANKLDLNQVLSLKPLYIIIWIIFFVFSFWNIGTVMRQLDADSIMIYILPIYGTSLVLLVVTAVFFLFMSNKIDSLTLKAGILFVIGAIIFYASDSILAHGKYNKPYLEKVGQSLNSTLIMLTYYLCQFLIASGALAISDYKLKNENPQTKQIIPMNSQNVM